MQEEEDDRMDETEDDPTVWFDSHSNPQAVAIILQHAQLPPASKRVRKTFMEAVRQMTPATRRKIRQTALEVPGTKRKRRRAPEEPVKRPRIHVDEGAQDEEMEHAESLLDGPFFRAVDAETVRGCITRYIDGTSNASLEKQVCLVCARELFSKEFEETMFEDLPNKRQLIPIYKHAAHRLRGDYLLHEDVMDDAVTYVCVECLCHLRKDERPRLALSNGMWIGRRPVELLILTLPERLLIALYFPAVYVVKLFPKGRSEHNWTQDTVNSGMRGNVSTYRLHRADIATIVSGARTREMPPVPKVLSATIGVTFVGAKNVPLGMLPDIFKVRRRRVRDALVWLRENNSLYSDIVISEERLDMLPQDGVPDEIVSTTRYLEDRTHLDREHAGYVPVYEEEEVPVARDVEFTRLGHDSALRPVTREGEEMEGHEPGVFLLQALGVVDTQGDSIPDNDVMAHALANTLRPKAQDEFAVRRGSAYVNEYPRVDADGQRSDGGPSNPNHMLGAFPVLFPYGKGGFETAREQEVPYETHVRWALCYSDRRFREDMYFLFQVFGVIQKRKICRSAGLQIKRSAFIHNEAAFLNLKPKDLEKASSEETRHVAFSNPVVQSLRRQITAVRARVPGTDESRQSIRSQVWGLTLVCNPASLWCTLNLADTDDPIAQVLAGEAIDMDSFVKTAGPTSRQRSLNVAKDPFAAAEFFHFTIKLILEEVFGIKAARGKISRKPGVCGTVEAYIGTVEAQGRGTLHLHILLWLRGAPTAQEMTDALKTESFRAKVREYIGATIRADIRGENAQTIPKIPIVQSVAWARPVDPRAPNYEHLSTEVERGVARTVQYHDCNLTRCLKVVKGRLVCKRRAPFPLSSRDWIEPDGDWGPRRVFGQMNNWNPAILQCIRANHDLKLITHGHETKDITWYITLYIAKKQIQASNASALLAKSLAFHKKMDAGKMQHFDDCKDVNKRMITRCANTLSREQEISGPEAVNYLMGWGDRFISHVFVTIFWDEVSAAIRRAFPAFAKKSLISRVASSLGMAGHVEDVEREPEPAARIELSHGVFVLKDQLREYSDRGHEMDDMSFFDYFLETYDGKGVTTEEENGPGRPRSIRVPYLESSKRKGCRIVRAAGHETMPRFVGAWFPRDTVETHEYYCASVLALLCPWRSIGDIKDDDNETFDSVFQRFITQADADCQRVVANINYFHECSESTRKRKVSDVIPARGGFLDVEDYIRTEEEREQIQSQVPTLTEEDVEVARANRWNARETLFGQTAVAIGREIGVFAEERADGCQMPERRKATLEEMNTYMAWGEELRARTRKKEFVTDNRAPMPEPAPGTYAVAPEVEPGVIYIEPLAAGRPRTEKHAKSLAILNREQRRAHDIIEDHLVKTLAGQNPPQLLMIVQGEGGTGKTVLLNAITDTFEHHKSSGILAKTATTGVAASLIAGQTLHSWAGIPIQPRKGLSWVESASKPTEAKRIKNISPISYLTIDEYSMLTKSVLAILSAIIGRTKAKGGKGGAGNAQMAFGGMSVVLFGDPHQFPPVGAASSAVYAPDASGAELRDQIGRHLYLQFQTVVTLVEQKRVVDPTWLAFLKRLRTGDCSPQDISMLRGLLVTDASERLDWENIGWSQPTLITPRHGARMQWNREMLQKHCAASGQRLYVFQAEDTKGKGDVELPLEDRVVVTGMKTANTAKLEERVEMAVGMRAMIVTNVATEGDLANGTRGVILDIVFDAREPDDIVEDEQTGARLMSYPPALVLFQPDHCTTPAFQGLRQGILPVVPTKQSFSITDVYGKAQTIYRRQVAVTAGYAFTDYKSQGQTMGHVFVDMASPPQGKLTPFNAYVALSRSSGRETIRLLRGFDEKLFTTYPSEDLAAEDERLRLLTVKTMETTG